jgi:hypothetical protein
MPDDKTETYKIDDAACSPEFGEEGCKIAADEALDKEKPE